MKIAIDISQIVYGTGVSNYTQNLVEALLKIDKKNEYLVFGTSLRKFSKLTLFKNKLSFATNVHFKFYRFPIRIFEILFNFLHFIPIEKFIGEFDVLHTSDWIEPKTANKNTKKITTIHDMVPFLFPTTLPKRIITNHKRKIVLVKKETDVIICPSQTTKEDIIKFMAVDPSKIKVVQEAASSIFRPQSEETTSSVLEKYKIKMPFILSVGTQEPRKNIHTLIDAFELLSKDYKDICLVLTGKKGWGQVIEVVPNVIQTGYVSDSDLAALYASCKVFAYPSLYEGFGLPVIEAMACGAPVVTTNNSAMSEIAKDAAILVDPRSEAQIKKAFELILNLETSDYQKMVRASLDRARQFTWAKSAKETLKIYTDVFEGTK